MSSTTYRLIGSILLLLVANVANAQSQHELDGLWAASLESPGGALRFQVLVESNEERTQAYLINGPEKIKVPRVSIEENQLLLAIPHYDSKLVLDIDELGDSLSGFWQKTRGKNNSPKMKAVFARNQQEELEPVAPFLGRWVVDFSSSEDPSVATIRSLNDADDKCWATFQTTTGDYRFLSGNVRNGRLELSVFDGAHAFLFTAELDGEKLTGDFWSSLNWHETWSAEKNDQAKMPDAFAETTWKTDTQLGDFKFPNLDGEPTSLNDPAFTDRPRLIHVFGSWCPNCHDAGIYLGELQKKYGEDLSVLGLAFELTGDFERDAKQVRIFHQRHETNYPTLIAGLADKQLASQAIPFLDRVRSYPTTIFIDASGKVVDIHTGFNGPATESAYESLCEAFESRIDKMIKSWKDGS